MNFTCKLSNISRRLGVGCLLVGLFLTEVQGQPRVSLHIERLEFSGNLLRVPGWDLHCRMARRTLSARP